MKQTIVLLGLIASAGSISFLPNKTLAENRPSNPNVAAAAIRPAILGNNTTQANYTATDEDGNPENVQTGESKTTSE